jgi:DNA polymerase-3 subunit delta
LLALAARAGWGLEELESPSPSKWEQELQTELSDVDVAFLKEVALFCKEENLRAPEGDVSPLTQRLHSGLPDGHVLVISASEADAKNPLVAWAKSQGRLIDLKVSQRLKDLDLNAVAADFLAPFGKKLGRGVEAVLKDRIGGNLRLLQSELEKLAAYADKDTIEKADVELLVGRARDEEFMELSDALQKRDLAMTLRYVDDALGSGGHPLMLLGAVASIVRGLLESHERMRQLAPKGAPRSFDEFKSKIFPRIEAEAEANGGRVPHPYAAFIQMQAASRFQRGELREALRHCAEADLQLKSGGGRLVVERLAWTLCGAAPPLAAA